MNEPTTTFDVVLFALIDAHRSGSHGGGMIGKAAAVIEALGLDGGAPFVRPSRPLDPGMTHDHHWIETTTLSDAINGIAERRICGGCSIEETVRS